jgi:hypothetical protein
VSAGVIPLVCAAEITLSDEETASHKTLLTQSDKINFTISPRRIASLRLLFFMPLRLCEKVFTIH